MISSGLSTGGGWDGSAATSDADDDDSAYVLGHLGTMAFMLPFFRGESAELDPAPSKDPIRLVNTIRSYLDIAEVCGPMGLGGSGACAEALSATVAAGCRARLRPGTDRRRPR